MNVFGNFSFFGESNRCRVANSGDPTKYLVAQYSILFERVPMSWLYVSLARSPLYETEIKVDKKECIILWLKTMLIFILFCYSTRHPGNKEKKVVCELYRKKEEER